MPNISQVTTGHVDLQVGTRAEVLASLDTSEHGLTAAEAAERLARVGPNEPPSARHTAGIVQLALFLANPLVIILLIASLVSAVLGEQLNAAIIATMVLLSVALNFFQTFRSQ